MPEATASDVRIDFDTELSDSDVNDIITKVEREWKREYESSDFDGTDHIKDFEAAITQLRIAEGRGRRAEAERRESTTIEYESSEIENIRERVRKADPGDEFGNPSSLIRDTGRRTGTSGRDIS